MEQVTGSLIATIMQYGAMGAMIVGMAAFIWLQNRQIKEMHMESIAVNRELTNVLRDTQGAYVRLCEMLDDRPCLHRASALRAPNERAAS